MAYICNIPTDIVKNIKTAVLIQAGMKYCNFSELLNNYSVQTILDYISDQDKLIIRLLPEDLKINSKQKNSSAGIYYSHSYSITIVPNSLDNYEQVGKFSNQKMILFLLTNEGVNYMVGCNEQPLSYTYDESSSTLELNLSGDTYYPALRN